MLANEFHIGQHVCIAKTHRGVVGEIQRGYLRVKWSDGSEGVLYDDPTMVPWTGRLQPLGGRDV